MLKLLLLLALVSNSAFAALNADPKDVDNFYRNGICGHDTAVTANFIAKNPNFDLNAALYNFYNNYASYFFQSPSCVDYYNGPLSIAASLGQLDTVKVLVESKKVSPGSADSGYDGSAFTCAIKAHQLDVAQYLFDHLDLSSVLSVDTRTGSPMKFAIAAGYPSLAIAIADKATYNDEQLYNSLRQAVLSNDLQSTQYLLTKIKSPFPGNILNRYFLMVQNDSDFECHAIQPEELSLLVSDARVTPFRINSILSKLVRCDRYDLVEKLLTIPGVSINARSYGCEAATLAQCTQPNTIPSYEDFQDEYSDAPIHSAVRYGKLESLQKILAHTDVDVNLMINSGNLDIANNALGVGIINHQAAAVKLLLADPRVQHLPQSGIPRAVWASNPQTIDAVLKSQKYSLSSTLYSAIGNEINAEAMVRYLLSAHHDEVKDQVTTTVRDGLVNYMYVGGWNNYVDFKNAFSILVKDSAFDKNSKMVKDALGYFKARLVSGSGEQEIVDLLEAAGVVANPLKN